MRAMLVERIRDMFTHERPAVDIAWIRIGLFGFFIYKLLCRDYSVFGFAPKPLLEIYPTEIFGYAKGGYTLLGVPWIVDLATFHWIHWILPMPGEATLVFIQSLAMGVCLLVMLLGRGPGHWFAIAAYGLLSYLWGYNWRSGAEVDAVFLPLQLVLIYCFTRQPEALTLFKPAPPMQFSRENGAVFSLVILVFVLYYFFAGVCKITDITMADWFRYNLIENAERFYQWTRVGHYRDAVPWLLYLKDYAFLNNILVPWAYIAELGMPLMFFDRRWIPFFAFNFIVFHLLTMTVGILFFGNVLLWFLFVPVHRLVQPVVLLWDDQCQFCDRSVKQMKQLDWFNRIHPMGFSQADTLPEAWTKTWDRPRSGTGMWVKGEESPDGHYGFFAFRRLAWGVPLFWLILPILYLPVVPGIGMLVYRWVARNRYCKRPLAKECHY